MELLQVFIVALGGTATAVAAIAYLAKALISQSLAREMENTRSRLKVEGDSIVESLKAKLQTDARLDDRQFELDQVMRRYQGPLLHAVYDLQSRLFNVLVNRFFDIYLVKGTPSQQQYARDNTAFLVAQFFGWTEIIRQEVQFIEFGETEKTRRLSDIRDEVYSLWQTDRLADPLMIWAGDQRAIGELMIEVADHRMACKGYANFLKSFGTKQEPLMDRLLEAVGASARGAAHDRLLRIQHKLIEMLDVLDPDRIRFRAEWRTKAPVAAPAPGGAGTP